MKWLRLGTDTENAPPATEAEDAGAAPRLRAVIESLDSAVLALGAHGERMLSNAAAERLLPSLARVPQLLQWAQRVTESGELRSSRLELPDERTLQVYITPLADADRHGRGCVIVARDITETVRLETARRDFIAAISHELRTPLTSIQGYAEFLQQNPDLPVDSRGQFLDVVLQNTSRLNRLAQDLVTLSSIETGTYPFRFEPLEAASLAGPALDVLAPLAAERGCLLLRGELGSEQIRGDRDALHRVLLNLLENALIHGRPGTTVELAGDVEGDEYVLEVRDDGPGISSADQPRVFERFYRVDQSHSSAAGPSGTGLGLSLVKHIVHEHGGRVELKSALGEGSTFRVHLPLAAGQNPSVDVSGVATQRSN